MWSETSLILNFQITHYTLYCTIYLTHLSISMAYYIWYNHVICVYCKTTLFFYKILKVISWEASWPEEKKKIAGSVHLLYADIYSSHYLPAAGRIIQGVFNTLYLLPSVIYYLRKYDLKLLLISKYYTLYGI